MQLGGYCPGCGGGPGNQSCHIASCSLDHDAIQYCFECAGYPCAIYQDIDVYDSFISHQLQTQRLNRTRDEGVAAITDELLERRELLDELLAHYNDGHHKTYYCIATSLLPLDELHTIMTQLNEVPVFQAGTVKEQAAMINREFNTLANQHGIVLKLRKASTS